MTRGEQMGVIADCVDDDDDGNDDDDDVRAHLLIRRAEICRQRKTGVNNHRALRERALAASGVHRLRSPRLAGEIPI